MKTTIILFIILFGYGLKAQDLEKANKEMYYERYQSAESTYHALLKQNPGNAAAWYGLMNSYLMQSENKKASDSLKLAPSSVHHEPYYQVASGYNLLAQDNRQAADVYFNKALDETRQKDAGILAAIANAHIVSKNGNAQYAISLMEKAIKREKKDASLHVMLGDAYRKLNNGSEAYRSYKEALEIDSKYAAALHKAGEIFLTQKNAEIYLDYFIKALEADPDYAPALKRLYAHYFTSDPAKALQYYSQYVQHSDPGMDQQYDLADLLYVNKQYNQALAKANAIVGMESVDAKPRIYKLIAHSNLQLNDTAKAINALQQYFAMEADSNIMPYDLATMGDLLLRQSPDSAMAYYEKAMDLESDSSKLYAYYRKVADLEKNQKDYAGQAKWLEKFYTGNKNATNIDLFYWGVAHYQADEFQKADSVFGLYIAKYPEQSFGYYWKARINTAMDKDMAKGLALPYYEKVVELLQNDTANQNYKSWMVEAYAYMAAYEANSQKDYVEAVDYFQKVLQVDPANEDAKKYNAILEKNIQENRN
jgi:tetratricopeptide (TPR) repeat protein